MPFYPPLQCMFKGVGVGVDVHVHVLHAFTW